MTRRRRPGTLRPAGWISYSAIAVVVLLIAGFPLLFPHGIQTGGPSVQQGLFTVTDGNWARAGFQSRGHLEENERLRPQGMQRGNLLCLDTAAVRPQLERALGAARLDRHGTRGLWIEFTATKHFGRTDCLDGRSGRRGPHYGSFYRVTALRAVRPLACSALTFIFNRRRCPAPPPPPKPIVLSDSAGYPAEALRRGAEGRVMVEALVGPKDELLECKPVASSGDAALDRAACEVFAAQVGAFAGKGSAEGLAAGVRRIRAPVRFALDKSAPPNPSR